MAAMLLDPITYLRAASIHVYTFIHLVKIDKQLRIGITCKTPLLIMDVPRFSKTSTPTGSNAVLFLSLRVSLRSMAFGQDRDISVIVPECND